MPHAWLEVRQLDYTALQEGVNVNTGLLPGFGRSAGQISHRP